MAINLFADMFSHVDAILLVNIGTVATNVIASIKPVATTLLIIYVTFWGWSMMRGVISEPVYDGAFRMIRLSAIVGFALNIGLYNTNISKFLWDSPNALAAVVSGTAAAPVDISVNYLDTTLSNIFDAAFALWDMANATVVPSFGLILVALLVVIAGSILTSYAAFLFILSKIGLAILLGVGPIFILLLIYEPTKKFFDAWLGQAINYVFTTMLTASVLSVFTSIISSYITSTNGSLLILPDIIKVMPIVILCIIAVLVLHQVPSIASALAGGVAMGSLSVVALAFKEARAPKASRRQKAETAAKDAAFDKANPSTLAKASTATGRAAGKAAVGVYRKLSSGRSNSVSQP
ncbi:MAG: type IV secretion system protein [Glaciimonas sp.]|nr:type IV secretion system protein [Glaciimonas sp.]